MTAQICRCGKPYGVAMMVEAGARGPQIGTKKGTLFMRTQDQSRELVCEAVFADGHTCWECHDTAPNDMLLDYSFKGGEGIGLFCSEDCAKRWCGFNRP
jgi:hypothetical protein